MQLQLSSVYTSTFEPGSDPLTKLKVFGAQKGAHLS